MDWQNDPICRKCPDLKDCDGTQEKCGQLYYNRRKLEIQKEQEEKLKKEQKGDEPIDMSEL